MPPSKSASVKNAKAKSKKPAVKAVAKRVRASKPAKAKASPRLRQANPAAAPSGPYLGQIASLPFDFAPQGWAACKGQIMPIRQNVALFQLIRTTYGGNGAVTFMLPNLPPRSPSGPWYYIAIEGVVPS